MRGLGSVTKLMTLKSWSCTRSDAILSRRFYVGGREMSGFFWLEPNVETGSSFYLQEAPIQLERIPLEQQAEGGQASELPLCDDFRKGWEDVVLVGDGYFDLEVLNRAGR